MKALQKRPSLKLVCWQIGASACANDEFQLIGATDSHTCPRGLPCRAGRQPRSHQHAEQPPECRQTIPLFPNWAANSYHALQAAVLTKAAPDCVAAAGKSPQAQVSEPLKTSGEDTDEDDEDEESEEPIRKGPGRKKRTAPILVETEDGETKYVSPAEFRKLRRCASGIVACCATAFRDPRKLPTPCRLQVLAFLNVVSALQAHHQSAVCTEDEEEACGGACLDSEHSKLLLI